MLPDFSKAPDGLLPAVAQDVRTQEVLMVAWVNREAFEHAIKTGRAAYWSRSRKSLWVKGDTSGHLQKLREIWVDCDGDSILYRVEQTGAACHDGYFSCFYRRLENGAWSVEREKVVENPS